jgi:hypothetical protein
VRTKPQLPMVSFALLLSLLLCTNLLQFCVFMNNNFLKRLNFTTLLIYITKAQLAHVQPSSVEHQFTQCRGRYRSHISVAFERAVARTVHYTILTATETSVSIVKSGIAPDTGLELGRNLFVVNLSPSSGLWTCVDGCGKATYKGQPCVHILKALQSKGFPFYDESYFHSHWLMTPVVTSKDIRKWCQEHVNFADPVTSDDDDDDQDPGDDDASQAKPGKLVVRQSVSDASQIHGMSKRFAYAKKLFDNVAKVSKSFLIYNTCMYLFLYSSI